MCTHSQTRRLRSQPSKDFTTFATCFNLDRVPYVKMKGIEFMLKTLELRDPRAKTFDPANVVDSSFIQELEKSGFIDAAWKR